MQADSLNILYEDNDIIVCVKPHGIATQSKKIGRPDMVSLLKNHIYQNHPEKGEPYLAVIHRLDQPVTGILVFAKTAAAAKALNKQLQSHGFGKYYRALVEGCPPKKEDTVENYMVKNGKTNTARICDKNTEGAKLARLHYVVVEKGQGIFHLGRGIFKNSPSQMELDIHLDTGRHHQIRVQLANLGCPIIGDTKYNPHASESGEWQQIQLCAYRLEFEHPRTHKLMKFQLSTL